MTMLAEAFALRDVEDVEALCRGVIREMTVPLKPRGPGEWVLRTSAGEGRQNGRLVLSSADYDEALGYLLGEAVILERSYDQTRAGIVFRPWLYNRLRYRLVDFWRAFYGRKGQHRVADLSDGSDPQTGVDGQDAGLDDGNAGPDRLEGPAGGSGQDDLDDRLATCGGLLSVGDRAEDGKDREPGGLGDPRSRRGAPAGIGRARAAAASPRRGAPAPYRDCLNCGWRSYAQAPNGEPGWHYPDACPGCGAGLEAAA